ncbi:pentatricopeptide repeat-containing protein At1g53600, mitochondrial [Asparagus officinalis]|nr:pentatricopeptide repeat-containing protein At1g53600, mitochondrial [Asparagus officinalis]
MALYSASAVDLATTDCFLLFHETKLPPTKIQYPEFLPSPIFPIEEGADLHQHQDRQPFCNSQITKNGRRGDLVRAQLVFDRMPYRDVVSWTALLTAYAENGRLSTARDLFDQMPDRNTAAWNAMVSAYIRSSDLAEAFRLFCVAPSKNLVSFSAMISGFAKKGMMEEAEDVFREMPGAWRDPVGSNALINGYLKIGNMEEAERIFRRMSVRDVVSWTSMVDGYCKCGRMFEALQAFSCMPERNVVSWTSLIRGFLKNGNWEGGIQLFSQMRRDGVGVNSTTLSVVLDACADLGRSEEGLQVHGLVLLLGFVDDVFVGNSIIVMYSRVGWIDAARRWFNDMSSKDVVSWNSILDGYVEHGYIDEAFAIFEAIPEKDQVSWTSMLVGFSNLGWMNESVGLFEAMPEKDDVAWTAIISGFVSNGENATAFKWFHRMMKEGFKPNPMTLSSVLSALAGLAILNQGVQIHALVVKLDLESDLLIQPSLVSMYSKCGDLGNAHRIFSGISEPSIVAYNAMITGLAQHGFAREALELFTRTGTDGCCKPNQVTFLVVLTACSHAGLVQEGYQYFESMASCYGIEPGPDHYTCMIDLLGRSGLLQEAKKLIDSMPFQPNSSAWGALLNASRLHSNPVLARLSAERIFQLEPNNATAYAMLSNIYSEAERRMNGK